MRLLAIVVLAAAVCGCSTTTPAQRTAINQSNCSGYGFKAGSEAYAACMMQLDLADQQADREQRRRIGETLSEFGENQKRNQPVTCSTYGSANRGFGNTVYGNSTTTCY